MQSQQDAWWNKLHMSAGCDCSLKIGSSEADGHDSAACGRWEQLASQFTSSQPAPSPVADGKSNAFAVQQQTALMLLTWVVFIACL